MRSESIVEIVEIGQARSSRKPNHYVVYRAKYRLVDRGGFLRVLVVEDEPDLLAVVSQALVEDGYAVDQSDNGEQGLEKALTWPYDLIVLDIMLPKMDGLTVLSKIRQQKSTPVLILTARDALDDRLRGLDGGADDYLVKPFSVQEMLARVRAVIRRSIRYR